MSQNPLLTNWDTPFGIPPFDLIERSHYSPAFEEAFRVARFSIDTIAGNTDVATFSNTIEAMERAEELLERVSGVFDNLSNSDASDEIEALERDLAPKFAAFSAETLMNVALLPRLPRH